MIHGSRNSQTVMDKSFYLNIQKKRWGGYEEEFVQWIGIVESFAKYHHEAEGYIGSL